MKIVARKFLSCQHRPIVVADLQKRACANTACARVSWTAMHPSGLCVTCRLALVASEALLGLVRADLLEAGVE